MESQKEPCELCGGTFKDKNSLLKHVIYHHKKCMESEKVLCELCGGTFKDKISLHKHMIFYHKKGMESQNVLCELCGYTFKDKISLHNHLNLYHKKGVESQKVLCELCGGTYKNKKTLRKHVIYHHEKRRRVQHKETCNICYRKFRNLPALDSHIKTHTTSFGKASCTECNDFTCRYMRDLRSHLECQHGISIEKEEMEFDSMELFLQWKVKMEDEKRVSFTKQRGGTLDIEKSKIYYLCHRSGSLRTKGLGQRLSGPSVKIDRTCPASLIATKLPSGRVHILFYKTHTGHNFSMDSLRLTHADRAMVADLIAAGLSETEILKKVRDDAHKGGFRRVHMLKRKDIYNIKKQYKLDISVNNSGTVSVEEPSSVDSTEDFLTAAQDRCDLLKEMMARVDNENIKHYVESLDRLIQQASDTIASRKENSNDIEEFTSPENGQVVAIIYI